MPKALTISGMAIAALFFLMFGLDLVLGFPFSGASKAMDITFLLSAIMLGYMSWSTFREQV